MKNTPTKCTVKLRKHEERNEWYLYIESYPVYVNGSPKRVREYMNRSISTPIWNKSSVARSNGSRKSYRPRRDVNGVIMCRTSVDNEACMFADRRKNELQHEYDNAYLFTDSEVEHVQQQERSQQDFISYFQRITYSNHINSSTSIVVNWKRVGELLLLFTKGVPIPFSTITVKLIEDFRKYLLSTPCGGKKHGTISQSTASTYFSIFKAALKHPIT